jgi:hypothetical protein
MEYDRRTFIETSAAATTALLLASLDVFGSPKGPHEHASAGFSLTIMAPYWGFNGSVTEFCRKAKEDGYDGVEILWSPAVAEELFDALGKFKLEVASFAAMMRRSRSPIL